MSEKLKCPCEDHWFCEIYQRLDPNPEYCINYEKLKEGQEDKKTLAIIEVPYKITKEYLESIQNWDSKSEEERSELHGD